MISPIRVGIIGLGRAGMIHAKNFFTRVPYARLAAIVEPDHDLAKKACLSFGFHAAYSNYHQLLDDNQVDAVVVVTPTKYHKEIVVASAQVGKHVFCEKPMAMDVSECNAMIDAAEVNHIKLQIGFMRRFDESYQKAKIIVENGDIGDIVLVKSNTRGPSIPQKWMYDLSKSNGPLAEVNSHDIDTLRWFTGSEFKTVHAIGGNFRCPEARDEYPDFYDNVIMNARFTNGMMGQIDGAQGVEYGYDARSEILGTKGCIFLGQLNQSSITVCNNSKNTIQPTTTSWTSLFSEAYLSEDISFIQSILEDTPTRVTGQDGVRAVQVVTAGNLSIVEKRIVEIPDK